MNDSSYRVLREGGKKACVVSFSLSQKNCDDRPRVRNKEKEEEFTGGFTTMAIHHRAGPHCTVLRSSRGRGNSPAQS